MKKILYYFSLIFLSSCSVFSTQSENKLWIEMAYTLTQSYKHASEKGDIEKMVSLYSDRLMEANGGREAMIQLLSSKYPSANEILGNKIFDEQLMNPTLLYEGSVILVMFPVERRVYGWDTLAKPMHDMYTAVSRDGGSSWSIIPGSCISEEDIRKSFLPSYKGTPPIPNRAG